MPLVVVDNSNRIRLVASAVVEREAGEDLKWVLQQFKAFAQCSPKCILSDQGAAIGVGVREVFPNSQRFTCGWHLRNNFAKYTPPDWSDVMQNQFLRDWDSVVFARSVLTATARLRRIRQKYQHAPNLMKHVGDLAAKAGEWAVYARVYHHSLFLADSVAESIHAVVKGRLTAQGTLTALVQSTFAVLKEQAETEQRDRMQYHLPATLDETEKRIFQHILQSVATVCTSYAMQDLVRQIKRSHEHQVTRITSETFVKICEFLTSNAHVLPSDGEQIQDIPDSFVEFANNVDEVQLFRVDATLEAAGMPECLKRRSDLVAYSSEVGAFICTCLHAPLRGFLCSHFLAVFRSTLSVYYHHIMWHPRWFVDAQVQMQASILPVNRGGGTLTFDAMTISLLRERSQDLYGPAEVQDVEETPNTGNINAEQAAIMEDYTRLNTVIQSIFGQRNNDHRKILERALRGLLQQLEPYTFDTMALLRRFAPPAERQKHGNGSRAVPYKAYERAHTSHK